MLQQLKNIYHLVQALLACSLYGFPSNRLKVIGVTGTDGKTTTTHLIHSILKHAGKKVVMSSTISAPGLHLTTPNPFYVQKMLKDAVDNGVEYVVLETSSHALDQNRVWGVHYEVGVVTNVTHEHLDYHGTYEKYLYAKALLLKNARTSIVNRDDQSYEHFKKLLDQWGKAYKTYALKNSGDFTFNYKKEVDKSIPDFNNYNFLAAYSATQILGIDEDIIIEAIKHYKLPPGRMEKVHDGKFMVMIDFAHTPNGLEQLLKTLRDSTGKAGKLIHVFGSAGLRDHSKRPTMGAVSEKYADHTILTEEDYRTEDPEQICEEIKGGMKKKQAEVLLDREEAIDRALRLAKKGDVVVITGKGHEQSLARGDKEYPWDDRKAVERLLKQLS